MAEEAQNLSRASKRRCEESRAKVTLALVDLLGKLVVNNRGVTLERSQTFRPSEILVHKGSIQWWADVWF